MTPDRHRRNGAYIRYQRLDVRGRGQKRLVHEMRITAARLGEERPGV